MRSALWRSSPAFTRTACRVQISVGVPAEPSRRPCSYPGRTSPASATHLNREADRDEG